MLRVVPSPISDADEYEYVEDSYEVYKVLKEHEDVDSLEYTVMFMDTHTERVSGFIKCLPIENNGTWQDHF